MLIRIACDDHLHGRTRRPPPCRPAARRARAAPPRHVQQIGDAEILQRLEGERAGMQQGGKAHDGRRHVRHDAERAAERRHHAGARAARQAGRQRIEHAGAGRCDDDQGCDQEIDAHAAPLSGPAGYLTRSRRSNAGRPLLDQSPIVPAPAFIQNFTTSMAFALSSSEAMKWSSFGPVKQCTRGPIEDDLVQRWKCC